MKNLKYDFNYTLCGSFDELPKTEINAVQKAKEACNNSYSPYSNFRVGAAAILDNGEIITAANQESEVFPSGMCAERVLLFNILSNYKENKIETLVIYSDTSTSICTPCGACRQVIADAKKRQQSKIKLIMCSPTEALIIENCDYLLPFSFNLE